MGGIDVMSLPLVNAILNSIACILLVTGYVLIRKGKQKEHKKVMILAFMVSTLFLISYISYHALRGGAVTSFGGEGDLLKLTYKFILVPHVLLAAVIPVLAPLTIWRGLSERFVAHKKLARWTLPIWLFVSVTGVLVYLMLYVWYPAQ